MPREANEELPVVLAEQYEGGDRTYKKVLTWTVGGTWDRMRGRLGQIRISSSDYPHTRLRLTVVGKTMFKDLEVQREMIIIPHRTSSIERKRSWSRRSLAMAQA